MSKIFIQGVVDDIRSKSNIYTPILEAVVNSIQSIGDRKNTDGKIRIVFHRENTLNLSNDLSEINGVSVIDNGIGFTTVNRDSFDTFRSPVKKDKGGKGFGRFMFLKFFDQVAIESFYSEDGNEFRKRKFRFGKKYDIIEDEDDIDSDNKIHQTTLSLKTINKPYRLEKHLETIGRKLLEELLIYFVDNKFKCPEIILEEFDGSLKISLNDFLEKRNEISLLHSEEFSVAKNQKEYLFQVKIFKIYYTQRNSRISLVAQNREVIETPLHNYIPEFEENFYETSNNGQNQTSKNYIIKAYVIGDYLTENVLTERDGFQFDKENGNEFYPISQKEIEVEASAIVKKILGDEFVSRANKKREQIENHINNAAPWHKPYVKDIDFNSFSYNASSEKIEQELQKYKYEQELEAKREVAFILNDDTEDYHEKLEQVLSKVTQIGKSDLVHYVSNRKVILDIFQKLLKRKDDGSPEYEKEIHNIIFPMGSDSTQTLYEDHNLWLLDERLVFSDYIASDRKIGKMNSPTEPDLVIFDKKRSFRSGDNEFSNPLTIFEFKRPKRTNYSADDDPVIQIGNYLQEIRDGKYETPDGVEKIKVNNNTPVYGYVVCDLTDKIKTFARNHSLTLSPDEEGYFGYHTGFDMYIEILSFKKLMKDASLRNKIFFKKLQIE